MSEQLCTQSHMARHFSFVFGVEWPCYISMCMYTIAVARMLFVNIHMHAHTLLSLYTATIYLVG